MKLSYKTLPFTDVKSEGDGSEFSGYCAAFHNVDSYGDVILPGAFKDGLEDYLANGQICYEHGPVIGKPLDAREDAKGLFVKGRISDTSHGRDCKVLLKDGVVRKMSIGYRGIGRRQAGPDDVKSHWQAVGYQPTKEDLFNLENRRGYLSFLTAIKLYEASPVGFPANTQADITQVKGLRLSAVKSAVRRVRDELKAGRKISQANLDRLKAVHDHLDPACKDLASLLSEIVPRQEPDGDEPEPGKAAELDRARNDLALLSCDPVFSTQP